MKKRMSLWVATLVAVLLMVPATVAAQEKKGNFQKGDYGYLYCHMNDRGRAWTAYALSRDGMHYHDLLNGDSVFSDSEHARIEGATRDAYIFRKHDGTGYLMLCTDMNVGAFKRLKKQAEWDNYGIDLLRSDDLLHWESVTFDFRKGTGIFSNPEVESVYKDWKTVNRVWAPQAVWDDDYVWPDGRRGGYFVYYSMWNRAEEQYDRMYYSYADESFTQLTQPRLLFDWGYATIDADINWVKTDRQWHMMIKKEGGTPGLFTTAAPALTGPWPEPSDDDYVNFEGKKKCEGVSAFQLAGHDDWVIGYIEYSSRPKNYRLCLADETMHNFREPRNIEGVDRPQHGSFLRITKEEYDRLETLNRVATDEGKVNDNNTPLHLMKPAYRVGYGVSAKERVKATMDRVLRYIDAETPAQLVDKKTGEAVTDMKKITADTQLKQGGFRLTSYEWGVTYSGVLAAYEVTGDEAYRDYVFKRHKLLAEMAPYFAKLHQKGEQIDVNARKVVDPHALDDAGAVCCSMIKALLLNNPPQSNLSPLASHLLPLINNYADYIMNKEYRLADGTFARIRPQKNTVWLDDMFMGVPAVAYMGKYTGDPTYYDEAARQVLQFASRMWVPEKNLFRHGWVESMQEHPAFHWGRANGWAILTMCEVLDVLPEDHPQRAEIMTLMRSHLKGLAALQHHDGYWHQLLDRSDTYLETSATAIYAYCFAHAINKGWVDAKVYGPVAQLAWHAVEASVNDKGQVEGVCVGTGMGFDPAFYAYRPVHVMAAHGYGPVIWAGAEMLRLLDRQHPKMNDSAVWFYDEAIPTDAPIFNYDGSTRF